MRVGTAELRNRLSYYLRRVRDGVRVIVTDRGRPVAQLSPIAPLGATDLDARIAGMVEEGLVTAEPVRERPRVDPIALRPGALRASTVVSTLRDER